MYGIFRLLLILRPQKIERLPEIFLKFHRIPESKTLSAPMFLSAKQSQVLPFALELGDHPSTPYCSQWDRGHPSYQVKIFKIKQRQNNLVQTFDFGPFFT